jgi:hypothetical protein
MNITIVSPSDEIVLPSVVTITYNEIVAAVAIDKNTVYIYPIETTKNKIANIVSNKHIFKLVGKQSLVTLTNNIHCHNCQSLVSYMNNKKASRYIVMMKNEIINAGNIADHVLRAATVASIMMTYKLLSDNYVPNKKKYIFNNVRNSYLLYITALNDILSTNGPLLFDAAIDKLKSCSYLGRKQSDHQHMLNNLITIGVVKFNDGMVFIE